jgi:hypothetical protein
MFVGAIECLAMNNFRIEILSNLNKKERSGRSERLVRVDITCSVF